MSVWVLGAHRPGEPHGKAVNQALAAERMGVPTHVIASADAITHAAMTGGRVFLAQLETPAESIAAFFATPPAQAGRKILNAAPITPSLDALFGRSDMVIFGRAEFASFLQLDREPDSVASLLPVQRLLTRHNQAAVVILGAAGIVAVWADRTMLVPSFSSDVIDRGLAADCVCGVIAAAVAEGIGPQRAMTLAVAAASLAVASSEVGAYAIPVRAAIEAVIAAADRP